MVDNPVIVPDGEVMITGNFHGEPLAFAADMLAMAIAELASISERRVDRMLDPAFSRGLPPFLAPDAGTNSGYMLAQYTAASLVSENKVLAHPASVDTIPTSGKQEDHVSMGWTAVRKLREVVDERAHLPGGGDRAARPRASTFAPTSPRRPRRCRRCTPRSGRRCRGWTSTARSPSRSPRSSALHPAICARRPRRPAAGCAQRDECSDDDLA